LTDFVSVRVRLREALQEALLKLDPRIPIQLERTNEPRGEDLPIIRLTSLTLNQPDKDYRIGMMISAIVAQGKDVIASVGANGLCLDPFVEKADDLETQIRCALGEIRIGGCELVRALPADIEYSENGGQRIAVIRIIYTVNFFED
jgi:hypothetical protein